MIKINDLLQLKDPQKIMNSLKGIFIQEDYLQVFKDILSKYNIISRKDLLIRLAINIDKGISRKDFSNLENDLKQQHVLLNKNEWLYKNNHNPISLKTSLDCIKLSKKKLHIKYEYNE